MARNVFLGVVVCLVIIFYLLAVVLPPSEDRVRARNNISLSNLHLIGGAIKVYAQDHHGTLPPMQTMTAFENAICPVYIVDKRGFLDGPSEKPFVTNPNASGLRVKSLPDPNRFVLLYDAHAGPARTWSMEKGRAVLFADGHVQWVNEDQWPTFVQKMRQTIAVSH